MEVKINREIRNYTESMFFGLSLRQCIFLGPQHISLYSLQIEEGTPFYQMVEKGTLEPANENVDRAMYHDALDMLENTQEFISGFRILYKKPLMYKDTATVKIANTDGGYTVGIYKEDVLCTLVEIRK